MMSKIHFVSLFGVDLDYDILLPWCQHYNIMDYDSYTIFVHSMHHDCSRFADACDTFMRFGFNVDIVYPKPYTTQRRHDLLDKFAKSLDPLDYMVVADSDEFHRLGNWGGTFREAILSSDILEGKLVDRWGDRLVAANNAVPLELQYPYSGDLFTMIFDSSDCPEKSKWRSPNRNKILAARAGLPVAHQGSHVLYKRDTDLRAMQGFIVEHYKWRHTISDRLKTKWYYRDSYDKAVAEQFGVRGVTK